MCTPAMLLSTIIGKTKGAVKTAIRILHNVTSDLTVGAVITLCDIHYKKPVLLDHLHHRKKVYGMVRITVLKKNLELWKN